MRSVLTTLLCILLSVPILRAQSIEPAVINVSGNSFHGGAFNVDWSIGEMALVNRMSALNSTVITNGFLQPFIEDISINNSTQFGAEEIFVFPSPATSQFEINFRTRQQGLVKYILYTASGQQVYQGSFNSTGIDRIEQVPANGLASGIYILRIELMPAAGFVKKKGTYRILKTH